MEEKNPEQTTFTSQCYLLIFTVQEWDPRLPGRWRAPLTVTGRDAGLTQWGLNPNWNILPRLWVAPEGDSERRKGWGRRQMGGAGGQWVDSGRKVGERRLRSRITTKCCILFLNMVSIVDSHQEGGGLISAHKRNQEATPQSGHPPAISLPWYLISLEDRCLLRVSHLQR